VSPAKGISTGDFAEALLALLGNCWCGAGKAWQTREPRQPYGPSALQSPGPWQTLFAIVDSLNANVPVSTKPVNFSDSHARTN